MTAQEQTLALLSEPFKSLQQFDLVRAVVCALAGLALAGLGVYREDYVMAAVFALGGLALAGYCAWSRAKHSPYKSAAIRVLQNDPHRIVWIYDVQAVSEQTGTHILTDVYFCFADGSFDAISVARVHGERLLPLLREVLPHATFGFSEEYKARYAADPSSLRRR